MTGRHIPTASRSGPDAEIEALAARQRSLFSRRQAASVGFTQTQIEHRLAIGRWLQPHHLVSALLGARFDERTRLLVAVLAAEPDAVASHRSAAALLGLPGFAPVGPAHVMVPDHYSRERSPAAVHYTLFLPDHHRRVVDDVPCTSLARTLFDLCGSERIGRSARALDTALARRQVTVPALWNTLDETRARGRPGSGVLRQLLRERGPGYVPPASELERRFVALADRHGLPRPRRQVDLGDSDRWIGRVDFLIGSHLIVEVDGCETHTSLLDRTADEARDSAFGASGRTVLRFTWDDVTRRGPAVAASIRAHLAAAAA